MTYSIWYAVPKNFHGATHHLLAFNILIVLFCNFVFQVFSFLDHINLCGAARVCKQWRSASAHEDFWKCLNFENRNISMEQCEF